MARGSVRSEATAAQVWRLMMECTMHHFGHTSGVLQELGLTPGHMKALLMLEPGEPRPMGSLAHQFACDASTITWLVDRLEERGLVERGGLPADRRVKTVVLTALGVKTKADLERRLYEPPPELSSVDCRSLEALRDVLTKLAEAGEPECAT